MLLRHLMPATFLLAALSSPSVAETETISILTYHNHPPFVNAPSEGETYDLAAALNQQAGDRYRFQVVIVPRSRLNLMLKDWIVGRCPASNCDDSWIVPWVNPKWGFIKGERDNYLWEPLLEDANVIISPQARPIDYQAPSSLLGLTFGGMRGHNYVGIDELAKQGLVTRIDGNHERDNLLKLLHGRIDATLLPRSTMEHLARHDSYIAPRRNELYVATTPHQRYTRFAMIPEDREELRDLIAGVQATRLATSD